MSDVYTPTPIHFRFYFNEWYLSYNILYYEEKKHVEY